MQRQPCQWRGSRRPRWSAAAPGPLHLVRADLVRYPQSVAGCVGTWPRLQTLDKAALPAEGMQQEMCSAQAGSHHGSHARWHRPLQGLRSAWIFGPESCLHNHLGCGQPRQSPSVQLGRLVKSKLRLMWPALAGITPKKTAMSGPKGTLTVGCCGQAGSSSRQT